VPVSLRLQNFDSLHSVANPGRRATKRLVSSQFFWLHLAPQVTAWAREYLICQHSNRASLSSCCQRPFQCQLVVSSTCTCTWLAPFRCHAVTHHILSMVDHCFYWPEDFPLSSASAIACAAALYSGWVACFGVPAFITSDGKVEFTFSLRGALCTLLDVQNYADHQLRSLVQQLSGTPPSLAEGGAKSSCCCG
jgi:hypothetical protein